MQKTLKFGCKIGKRVIGSCKMENCKRKLAVKLKNWRGCCKMDNALYKLENAHVFAGKLVFLKWKMKKAL